MASVTVVRRVSVSRYALAYSVDFSHTFGRMQFLVVIVVYTSSSAIESAVADSRTVRINDRKYMNSMMAGIFADCCF